MLKILNLTQHDVTDEQRADGVFDPDDKQAVKSLLTFDSLPSYGEVYDRAEKLAEIAAQQDPDEVMIGGAPYLMGALEQVLAKRGLIAVYAFSKREVTEETVSDGSVKKSMVFRHAGFVKFACGEMEDREQNS